MEIIKELESERVTSKNGITRTRRMALFECPVCGNKVKRKRDDGLKQKRCCGGKGKYAAKGSKLHNIYVGMKQRCYDRNAVNYHNYGGRGIKVCKAWMNFDNFAKWALDNGFSPGLELDRIDNNGDYKPNNCRFVTRSKNQRNKRTNIHTPKDIIQIRLRYAAGGVTMEELAKEFNDSKGNISNIINKRTWDFGK